MGSEWRIEYGDEKSLLEKLRENFLNSANSAKKAVGQTLSQQNLGEPELWFDEPEYSLELLKDSTVKAAEAKKSAIDTIIQEHRRIEKLLKNFEETDDVSEQEHLLEQIIKRMSVHIKVEEALVYPFLNDEPKKRQKAYIEHGLLKRMIGELSRIAQISEPVQAEVSVLRALFHRHVIEEELGLLPKLKKKAENIQELGRQISDLETVLLQNFRGPSVIASLLPTPQEQAARKKAQEAAEAKTKKDKGSGAQQNGQQQGGQQQNGQQHGGQQQGGQQQNGQQQGGQQQGGQQQNGQQQGGQQQGGQQQGGQQQGGQQQDGQQQGGKEEKDVSEGGTKVKSCKEDERSMLVARLYELRNERHQLEARLHALNVAKRHAKEKVYQKRKEEERKKQSKSAKAKGSGKKQARKQKGSNYDDRLKE